MCYCFWHPDPLYLQLLNKGRVVHQAVVLNAQFTNYSTFDIIFSGALATALAPRARMLAYYTRDDKDKELIVDTLDFVSKDVFAHKVRHAFIFFKRNLIAHLIYEIVK